jgi:ABC-type multidrug transport system ATPase subunit
MGKTRKGERIYLAELDTHFPELTVGDTIEFAASMRPAASASSSNVDLETMGRTVASLFCLEDVYRTQIGNALIRGVSGGEKRRVSLAEALIAGAQYQYWDNSTRGLDSSTALRFVQLLRNCTNSLRLSIGMSIYQASESMYKVKP